MSLKETRAAGWLAAVGQNLAWLAVSAGAIIDAIYIREAVLEFLVWYRDRYLQGEHESGSLGLLRLQTSSQVTLVDFITIFVAAIAVGGVIVWLEYYFRKGRQNGLLVKRVLGVAAVEVSIVVASILIRMVL